jgi:hypothetical protein
MERHSTEHKLPLRYGDFATLSERWITPRRVKRGNFYNGRGSLKRFSLRGLREDAIGSLASCWA